MHSLKSRPTRRFEKVKIKFEIEVKARKKHSLGSESSVIILLLCTCIRLTFHLGWFSLQDVNRILIQSVDILLVGRYVDFDFCLVT